MQEAEIKSRESNAQDRVQIEEQVQRLLAHPLFRQARYLPSFLTYIVNEALDPKGDGSLKERTLGIHVFARSPDYDNNADPIVRVTATNLRKKLAQYYYEGGHEDEIRIDLRPGTYIPTFRPAQGRSAVDEPVVAPSAVESEAEHFPEAASLPVLPPETSPPRSNWSSPRKWAIAAVLVIAIAVLVRFASGGSEQASLERFWKQGAHDGERVSVVMPVIGSDDLVKPQGYIRNQSARPVLSLEDTNLAARVSGQLQHVKANYQIVSSADTTLAQLRNGPVVLIGALDNVWTLRLGKELPFVFEEAPDNKTGRIVGNVDGQPQTWAVNIDKPHSSIDRDYGIVARFEDRLTGRPTTIIAGISSQGTQAAGELLTSSEFSIIRAIADHAKNFEIVIQTEAVDGHAGQPTIVASRTW